MPPRPRCAAGSPDSATISGIDQHRPVRSTPVRRALRVAAAALALQLAFGIVLAWGAVVPLVRAQDHWPPVLLGAVFAATPLGYGIGTTVGGRLADRFPPRLLCWSALGLLGVGFGIAFTLPAGLTFLVCYAFVALGLGGGIALTGAVGALTRVLPGRTGAVGGAASGTYAAAPIVQAPLIGAAAASLGWIGALRLVGLGTAVLAGLLLLLMPPLPARPVRARGEGSPLPSLVRRPQLWAGFLVAACGSIFGAFAAVNIGAEAVSRELGPGPATAAITVFSVGNAGARLLAGLAADRIGVRWVVALVFALALAAGGLVLFGSGAGAIVGAALAAGMAFGGDAGSLSRVGADAAPGAPNTAFGMIFAGYALGSVLGPILGAALGTPTAWVVMGLPAAAGLAALAARPRLLTRPA